MDENRIQRLNDDSPDAGGKYVLYWMTAYRRVESNYALQRSAEWARHLGIPLVVLSALRLDYRWASDRTHAFILDSIADVDLSLHGSGALHFVFIEEEVGGGRGLLRALAAEAAVVVADDAPIFFFPSMVRTAAERVDVLMEGVDHNGILQTGLCRQLFHRFGFIGVQSAA